DEANTKIADEAVKALKKSKANSLVVAGSNNVAVQTLANKLNQVLGAYTSTINLNNPINLFMSQDSEMNTFVKNVVASKGPDALIMYGVNPAYTLPNGTEFAKGLEKIKTTVSLSMYADETA